MKIHVVRPLNAYIHLVDSFQALKVETIRQIYFRATFGIIHEYFDYSKTSATASREFIHVGKHFYHKQFTNILDFYTILDFLRTHHLLPSALAVIELSGRSHTA